MSRKIIAILTILASWPAHAGQVGLASPEAFGIVATPLPPSTAQWCEEVQFKRYCGTREQWRQFAQDACHRFRDGFGGDAVQCYEADVAHSHAEQEWIK
jgi:hypothetical protein